MFLDRRNDRDRTSLVPFFLSLARDRGRRRVLDLHPTDGANRGFLSQDLVNLLTNIERYAYPDGYFKIRVV